MESGACDLLRTLDASYAKGGRISQYFQCPMEGNAQLDCLRSLKYEEFLVVNDVLQPTCFSPTVDGVLLPSLPLHSIQKGAVISSLKAVLLGFNRDEGTFLRYITPNGMNLTSSALEQIVSTYLGPIATKNTLPYYLSSVSPSPPGVTFPSKVMSQLTGDSVFTCPTHNAALALSQLNIPVYLYEWSFVPPCSFLPPPSNQLFGAFHWSEIPFVFNTLFPSQVCPRSKDGLVLQKILLQAWTSFAASSVPVLPSVSPFYSSQLSSNIFTLDKTLDKSEDSPFSWPRFESNTRENIRFSSSPFISKSHSFKEREGFCHEWVGISRDAICGFACAP